MVGTYGGKLCQIFHTVDNICFSQHTSVTCFITSTICGLLFRKLLEVDTGLGRMNQNIVFTWEGVFSHEKFRTFL